MADGLSTSEMRELMALADAEALQAMGPCPPELGETWIDVALPDGWISRTRLVWPKPSAEHPGPFPLVVYFFGGGMELGSPDMLAAPARGLASVLRCVVACPSYQLIPEHPFPASVRSAWEVCSWLSVKSNLNDGALKGTGSSVDLARGFVVGGLSSGGTIAAIIGGITAGAASGLKDLTSGLSGFEMPITGIFAGISYLVHENTVPAPYKDLLRSREENADAPGFDTEQLRKIEQKLQADVRSPWYSPVNLDFSDPKIADHHPKKVFAYGGQLDPLRDDAIIYTKWLSRSSSIDTKCVIVEDSPHIGWVTPDWPSAHTRSIKTVTLNGFAWLLGKEWDEEQELPY
jgi:acetyl esterase/lipase